MFERADTPGASKMRVLLFGFGSRGDVQPFIALGKGLQRAGYEVTLAVGKNFESWVKSEGLPFEPIRVDVEALVQGDVGKDWINRENQNPMEEIRSMKRMTDSIAAEVVPDMLAALDRYDVFISGVLTVEAMNAAAESRGKTHIVGTMTPWTPTRSGASGMNAPIPRGDSLINLIFGYVVEVMMSNVLRSPSAAVRSALKLRPPTPVDFMRAWNRAPTLMGISPLVTPHPPDWGDNLHVTGYWFLDRSPDWQPSPELTAFLDAGDPPVYIGFGSMGSRKPEEAGQIALEALRRSGQRGVLASGWGGLQPADLPASVYLITALPHSWLFPRMAAVVHHGGAGTTAAGFRAGVPSILVPFGLDQPFWGSRAVALGVGTRPIPRKQLTGERLGAAITEAVTNPTLRRQAADLGQKIRAEEGIAQAVAVIDRFTQRTPAAYSLP